MQTTPVHAVSIARYNENIAPISEHNPFTSIRHHSQQSRLSQSNLQRILTKNLHFHVYKIQLTQY